MINRLLGAGGGETSSVGENWVLETDLLKPSNVLGEKNFIETAFSNNSNVTVGLCRDGTVAYCYHNNANDKWYSSSLPSSGNYYSITFSEWKNMFIVAGDNGKLYTSYDIINWSQVDLSTNFNNKPIGKVKFNSYNNKVIAISKNNLYAYTTRDFDVWTEVNLTPSKPGSGGKTTNTYYTCVAYASITDTNGTKDVYVATSTEGIYYSYDGFNWNKGKGLEKYIIKDNSGTETSDTYPTVFNAIIYGSDKFVAVGNNEVTAYSFDGINWLIGNPYTTLTGRNIAGVVYTGNCYVACVGGPGSATTNNLLRSTDGISWTRLSLPNTSGLGLTAILFVNNKVIAVGMNKCYVSTTSNFDNYNNNSAMGRTIGTSTYVNGIATDGTNIIICGGSEAVGKVATSADSGLNWTLVNSATSILGSPGESRGYGKISYISGLGFVISNNGKLAMSTSGLSGGTWSEIRAKDTMGYLLPSYTNTSSKSPVSYISGLINNKIFCFTTTGVHLIKDGTNPWKTIPNMVSFNCLGLNNTTVTNLSTIVSNLSTTNPVYVACPINDLGSDTLNVITSTDGITWNNNTNVSVILGGKGVIKILDWVGGKFFIQGLDESNINYLLSSDDGVNWVEVGDFKSKYSALGPVASITYSNTTGVYLVYSSTNIANACLRSSDGITWTVQTGFNNSIDSVTPNSGTKSIKQSIYTGTKYLVLYSNADNSTSFITSSDGVTWDTPINIDIATKVNSWDVYTKLFILGTKIYFGFGPNFYYSSSLNGTSWSKSSDFTTKLALNQTTGSSVSAIYTNLNSNEIFAITQRGYAYKSTDNGLTWTSGQFKFTSATNTEYSFSTTLNNVTGEYMVAFNTGGFNIYYSSKNKDITKWEYNNYVMNKNSYISNTTTSDYSEVIPTTNGFTLILGKRNTIPFALVSTDDGANFYLRENYGNLLTGMTKCRVINNKLYTVTSSNVSVSNLDSTFTTFFIGSFTNEISFTLTDIFIKNNVIYLLGVNTATSIPFLYGSVDNGLTWTKINSVSSLLKPISLMFSNYWKTLCFLDMCYRRITINYAYYITSFRGECLEAYTTPSESVINQNWFKNPYLNWSETGFMGSDINSINIDNGNVIVSGNDARLSLSYDNIDFNYLNKQQSLYATGLSYSSSPLTTKLFNVNGTRFILGSDPQGNAKLIYNNGVINYPENSNNWSDVEKLNYKNTLNSGIIKGFAYFNGKYYGLTTTGLSTSTDGVTWTNNTTDYSNVIGTFTPYGIKNLNGNLVIYGSYGKCFVSTNGVNFSTALSGVVTAFANNSTSYISDMVYDSLNTKYIAVGRNASTSNVISASSSTLTDSSVFTVSNSLGTALLTGAVGDTSLGSYKVIFAANKLVAIRTGEATYSSNCKCATSTDGGVTWTVQTSYTAANTSMLYMQGLAYSTYKNLFVAVGYPSVCLTSPDGITWTSQTSLATAAPGTIYFNDLCVQGGNLFYAVTSTNKLYFALDPTGTWTEDTSHASAFVSGNTSTVLTYVGGKTLSGTNGSTYAISNSTNGGDWTSIDKFSYAKVKFNGSPTNMNMIYPNLLMFGSNGQCSKSTDNGLTWTAVTQFNTLVGTATVLDSCIYAGGILVVTNNSRIYRSTTGNLWTEASLNLTVSKFNTMFTGKLMKSLAFGNGVMVVAGEGKTVAYSLDNGENWSTVNIATVKINGLNSSAYFTFNKVKFNSILNMFILVGEHGILLTSPDGINWTQNLTLQSVYGDYAINDVEVTPTAMLVGGPAGRMATSFS